MSVEIMSKVWEMDLPTTKKLVLLALADHADDAGANVYPSVPRVAWKSGLSTRQTRRVMQQLRDDDELLILVREGGGRGGTNEYRIDITKGVNLTPFNEWRSSATADQNPDTGDTLPLTPTTVNPDTGDTRTISKPSMNQHSSACAPPQKDKKPNPMKVLMDDLTDMGYSLSTNDRKPYAGQIAALRNAGVSEERIIKAVKRCASDWPDHPYSSLQKALAFAEKNYENYKNGSKKSEAVSEKPETADDWKQGFYDKGNFNDTDQRVEGGLYFDRQGNPVTHNGDPINDVKEYLNQHGQL
jgi:hypothetical protein